MCKLERYGNCDEETKDQEYCIFHKPNKSEEEAREFYEKFFKKFKPKKEIIRISGREIERLVFEETVNCGRYAFPEIPEDVDFSFEDSIFRRDVSFNGATFEGNASFVRATFEGDAWFWEVTFEGNAWFGGVTFERFAVFIEATFERFASFNKATFEGFALFDGATFKGSGAQFNGATFKGLASFDKATFEDFASFVRATFEEYVSFLATFKGNACFNGATFEEITNFWGKKEGSECKFYSKLSFLNTEFRRGVFIDIPSERFKLPSAEAEACRVQRISYEREGKKDDADRMFARERRALRKAEVEEAKANVSEVKGELKRLVASSPRKVERVKAELKVWFNLIKATSNYLLVKGRSSLEFFIADLTCEYGTNWKRPVISWIFLVFFIFPLLYFILGGITNVSSPLDYLYFSIVTATTLGYGDLQPIGWCRLIASTEAIFGTFMWAVFLVVFARKYMR